MKYKIVPVAATKRREIDSYSGGCDIDSLESRRIDLPDPAQNILDCMSQLVGRKLSSEEVYSFDPNIYCDTKQPPGFKVVEDNTLSGVFRVEHDRMENKRGKPPTEAEKADFEADKIKLYHVTYELRFRIQVADLDENQLAEFLGITGPA